MSSTFSEKYVKPRRNIGCRPMRSPAEENLFLILLGLVLLLLLGLVLLLLVLILVLVILIRHN